MVLKWWWLASGESVGDGCWPVMTKLVVVSGGSVQLVVSGGVQVVVFKWWSCLELVSEKKNSFPAKIGESITYTSQSLLKGIGLLKICVERI